MGRAGSHGDSWDSSWHGRAPERTMRSGLLLWNVIFVWSVPVEAFVGTTNPLVVLYVGQPGQAWKQAGQLHSDEWRKQTNE
eukprot:1158855-Pelagomonas_calceolata.AAC.7